MRGSLANSYFSSSSMSARHRACVAKNRRGRQRAEKPLFLLGLGGHSKRLCCNKGGDTESSASRQEIAEEFPSGTSRIRSKGVTLKPGSFSLLEFRLISCASDWEEAVAVFMI